MQQKNDYSRNVGGFHPRKVVMVQEVNVPKKAGRGRTYREVVSKEIHVNNGDDIYASRDAALEHA